MIKIELYYDESANYAGERMENIVEKLERINGRVVVSRVEKGRLSEKELERIVEEIRSIKPQARGSVVASGRNMMPLSGSKKLNLSNTPVVLVKNEESDPAYVFPCKVGEEYYDVDKGLSFLQHNLPLLPELPASTEESITRLILQDSELLEKDLKLLASEMETSTGRVDALFEDLTGRPLLLEVERQATDQALGQILRLCAGYENKNGLRPGFVRAGIACLRINQNVLAGAKRAMIEVWKIDSGEQDGKETSHKL